MYGTQIWVIWAVILAAAGLAYYFGYRAKNPKRYGGVIGTLIVYSFYALLPTIIMAPITNTLLDMGVWRSHGEEDIGLALLPILVTPVYWVGVFLGMSMSEEE